MLVGERTLTDVLCQEPAKPEAPPVRLKMASLRAVVPSGRIVSSLEVNVWPSAEMFHFENPAQEKAAS